MKLNYLIASAAIAVFVSACSRTPPANFVSAQVRYPILNESEATGLTVAQMMSVIQMEGGVLSWTNLNDHEWILNSRREDKVTSKTTEVKFVLSRQQQPSGDVILSRMVVNGADESQLDIAGTLERFRRATSPPPLSSAGKRQKESVERLSTANGAAVDQYNKLAPPVIGDDRPLTTEERNAAHKKITPENMEAALKRLQERARTQVNEEK